METTLKSTGEFAILRASYFMQTERNFRAMKKALLLGIVSSFFFAFTFLFNRSMNLSGGYWLWTAALRYLVTLPMLFPLAFRGKGVKKVFREIKKAPGQWLLWSTVGFGLFYAPLTMASTFAESWFTSAMWQFTIVAGVLLTPLFGKKIPVRNLLCSMVVLAGIFLLQLSKAGTGLNSNFWMAIVTIVIAAFSYPLGNRKMMQLSSERLSTIERVFGMTLCSYPFWIGCGIYAFIKQGLPTQNQLLQSLCVALFAGVIATSLFFRATDFVRNNPRQLAVVEATQCGSVVFTLLGGVLILGDPIPGVLGMAGLGIVLAGMVMNSLLGGKNIK